MAQKNPNMYERAYHRRAKLIPKISIENISGLTFGNGIIADLISVPQQTLKANITHNAIVTIETLL